MNLTATQIEDIVRVVVQRLRVGIAAPPVPATPVFQQLANIIQPAAGEIQVSDRVVTLESLKDILVDAQAIVVHPRAVVTPAVVDELRKRNIRLVRQLPIPSSQAQQPAPLLLVTAQELLPVLSKRVCALQATTISAQDAASTASHIEQNLSDGKLGAIWCSATPFASVAATYGHTRLRAMQLTDLRDLSRAIDQAQPNLLILDCHTWTAPAIANLVRNWYRSLR